MVRFAYLAFALAVVGCTASYEETSQSEGFGQVEAAELTPYLQAHAGVASCSAPCQHWFSQIGPLLTGSGGTRFDVPIESENDPGVCFHQTTGDGTSRFVRAFVGYCTVISPRAKNVGKANISMGSDALDPGTQGYFPNVVKDHTGPRPGFCGYYEPASDCSAAIISTQDPTSHVGECDTMCGQTVSALQNVLFFKLNRVNSDPADRRYQCIPGLANDAGEFAGYHDAIPFETQEGSRALCVPANNYKPEAFTGNAIYDCTGLQGSVYERCQHYIANHPNGPAPQPMNAQASFERLKSLGYSVVMGGALDDALRRCSDGFKGQVDALIDRQADLQAYLRVERFVDEASAQTAMALTCTTQLPDVLGHFNYDADGFRDYYVPSQEVLNTILRDNVDMYVVSNSVFDQERTKRQRAVIVLYTPTPIPVHQPQCTSASAVTVSVVVSGGQVGSEVRLQGNDSDPSTWRIGHTDGSLTAVMFNAVPGQNYNVVYMNVPLGSITVPYCDRYAVTLSAPP